VRKRGWCRSAVDALRREERRINDRMHAIGKNRHQLQSSGQTASPTRAPRRCSVLAKVRPSVGEGLNAGAPPPGGALSVVGPSPPASPAAQRPTLGPQTRAPPPRAAPSHRHRWPGRPHLARFKGAPVVSGYTGAVPRDLPHMYLRTRFFLRPCFASADFPRSIGNDSDDEKPIGEMCQGGGQL
jgi:hypothetical protein